MVIPPLTTSELVPLMVIRAVVPPVPVVKLIEVHAALAVTVTVIPLLMVTVSPATGTDAPPHVAVLFQFPVTLAVRAASVNVVTAIVPEDPVAVRTKLTPR